MNFEGLPEPWGTVLALIVGPVGALAVMALVMYFLWKLFREEQEENRKNFATVSTQADSIKELTAELNEWRTMVSGLIPKARSRS